MGVRAGTWLPRRPPRPDAEVRLFCLPHAGAGASAYREWPRRVDPRVDVVPIQLPGRERRVDEPHPDGIGRLAEQVVDAIADADGPPFALFGHSMGALIAYEVAHRAARRGLSPTHVVVSGYPAPQLPHPRQLHLLPDDEFVAHIAALQGTSADVLDDPALLRETLPILRADFTNCETYRHPDRPGLAVPLTVLGGRADPTTPPEWLERWRDVAAGPCAVRLFDGGHFYLHDHLPAVLAVVEDAVLAR